MPRDEAVAYFKSIGEHYKAEIIASIPAERGRVAVPRRRIRRPLPRPARAVHGQAEGLQADEGRRRLLARRPPQRDAAAHLRHGLGEEGRPGAYLHDARGGREARPPQARPRARPVPPRGEAPGMVFWHPKGWTRVAGGRAVHAPRLPRQRLPGGQGPADPRPRAVGEDRPLGQLPRQHVHDGVGEARLRAEADELPGPHPDLQAGHQELSRPAAALRRVRPVPPQRAVGRAARHHARARLHAGRRPHLLHRRADPRRVRGLHGAAAEGLRRLRLQRHHLQGRARGRRSASAPTRSGTRPRTR